MRRALSRSTKRAITLGASIFVATLVVAAACSFPDPALLDTLDATTDTAAPDAGPSADGSTDAALQDVVVEFDAPPPIDASTFDGDANVTAPDGAVVNCDVDRDGFIQAGGVCGGNDCDDKSANVRPNQDFNTFEPIPGTGAGKNGDWNCNGEVEIKGNTGQNANCVPCSGAGFVEDKPRCGSQARYVKCSPRDIIGCDKSDGVAYVECR